MLKKILLYAVKCCLILGISCVLGVGAAQLFAAGAGIFGVTLQFSTKLALIFSTLACGWSVILCGIK